MSGLSRFVQDQEYIEFSYSRAGETQFAGAGTIYRYVSYAKAIGLLDDTLASGKSKRDIRAFGDFQEWLSDLVVQHLNDNNCSVERIREAARALLTAKFPAQLPTPINVRTFLKNPLPPEVFRISLQLVSLLRPNALQVKSRQVILIPKSVEA
jgi:hypothetical protein